MNPAAPLAAPLVTVCMPVRNGGRMFAAALESVRRQDYENLEILISDNGSTDETADIARAAAAVDPRVIYVRQNNFLRVFDNFMALLPRARGQYFMWAAHDDLRSADYVSGLLGGHAPGVVLTFGDVEVMTVHGESGERQSYDFDNGGLGRIARIRKQALMQCYHFYGLWRTDALRRVPVIYCQWWADLPILMAAAAVGEFRYVRGPVFRYYFVPKSDQGRARYQDNLSRSSSKLRNIAALTMASFEAMRRTAGIPVAMVTAAFVVEKNLRFGVDLVRRALGISRIRSGL